MKFGIGILYKKLPSRHEFRVNGLSDSRPLLKDVMSLNSCVMKSGAVKAIFYLRT